MVIDGMGDLPIEELANKTPLEAAETPNMDSFARNGKNGLMYTVGKGVAPESDVAVISVLGYDPFKHSTGRGILEAIGADISVEDGDLALRCNFATLGDGKKIIDRRAGRDLTAEEAAELSRAVDENVKLESHPADFEFKNTIGHRAVLVIRSKRKNLSSRITNTDPAYQRIEGLGVAKPKNEMVLKKCEPTNGSKEAKTSAKLVNEFVDKSHVVLDRHKINKKRTARGKLKANVILTRDAGHLLPKFFNINEKYGVRFVSLTDMPVERGISKLTGMHIVDLPPPSQNLEKDCNLRVEKLRDLMPSYDCFYIHIKGPDEPGHDGKFSLKTRLISIIDKHFFGKLLQKIELKNCIVCVTADHATPCKLKAHSDDPVPLLISGDKIKGDNILKFSERECRKGSLGVLEHGTELMPKLISFLKA
ncbi:MAG: alkaline phosphatase family protein [Candidatus Bathyarchaeota archaeon]|nr:alkaline phosphatase family protein [Candidatus Bathyarchaeota archaeon]MDH5788776.1 alkaline phosphatase family protein [Candidatus Bathyarchaeota archaeon]